MKNLQIGTTYIKNILRNIARLTLHMGNIKMCILKLASYL